jgi:hypothetical protein
MADSIQEQIVKKIALALAEITVANGYENTIMSVQRHKASGINLSVLPTILIREGDCTPELTKSVYGKVRRTLEVYLVICCSQDEETDLRSGGEVLNSFVADIEKRLAATPFWDGLATLTQPPEYLEITVEAETPHLARGLRTEVIYEHLRADPFSQ